MTLTKALFTKTVTNVYQYEAEVDDLEMYQGRAEELFDTFPEATLVDTTWWVDVEEADE